MYIDVNGKVGYKSLVGTSGITYGNTKLFIQAERDAMLADGITEYVAPPEPAPSPEKLERDRVRSIKGIAQSRILEHTNFAADEPLDEVSALRLLIGQLLDALDAKNALKKADLIDLLAALDGTTAAALQVRQVANDAITNGVDVETAGQMIDSIIPPQQP